MQIPKKIKKAWDITSTMLIVIVVIFAILLGGIRLFGLSPYSVLSGSMESVYPTGSLIYVKEVEPETLKVGDVITFKMSGGTVATHRIIELVPDENDPDTIRFRTKGDENEIADGPLVNYGSIIGSPVFCIPFLGYLATYIMQTPGKYIAIAIAVILIGFEIVIGIVFDDKDKKKLQSETVQN